MQKIIERAKNLLLKPAETWDSIASEKTELAALYRNWVMPLVAIGAIAQFIGTSLIGVRGFGATYRVPIVSGLVSAIVAFALSLVMVWAFAKILEWLAPKFGAKADFGQALKLSAYFPTAAWIFAGFQVLPALAALGLIGFIWSIYLLFVGLPKLMKPDENKATTYTLASMGCAIVLALVLGLVSAAISPKPHFGPFGKTMSDRHNAMDQAAESDDLNALIGAMTGAGGKTKLVEPDAIEKLAPGKLAGLPRTSLKVENLSFPVKMVKLTARYNKGGKSVNLEITHSPAIKAILAMSGVIGSSMDVKTESGYKKINKKGNDTQIEEWEKDAQSGMVGRAHNEFLVEARGHGVDLKQLRKTVKDISNRKLDRLPRQK
ncbi:MAG: hypothetical protein COA47_02065 [Robiginitomaculum sp.]|nr:MAG: hypothetical protein COA47_02065 [Robiginitomaculum sp.]